MAREPIDLWGHAAHGQGSAARFGDLRSNSASTLPARWSRQHLLGCTGGRELLDNAVRFARPTGRIDVS